MRTFVQAPSTDRPNANENRDERAPFAYDFQFRASVPSRRSACYPRRFMRFVFALLAACLFVLSLTNASGASAAVPCEPSPTEMLAHFEGDADEVPNCPESGTTHHHQLNCGAHQAAPAGQPQLVFGTMASSNAVALSRDFLPPGLEPASEPHPPKA